MNPTATAHDTDIDVLRREVAEELLRKTLREFLHERILRAVSVGDDVEVRLDQVTYRFSGTCGDLEHWHICPGSVLRVVDGVSENAWDPCTFILDAVDELGISDKLLPVYLEEMASTISTRLRSRLAEHPTSRELVEASLATVEAAMSEGHPGFVAGSGRVGFGADESRRYAPEAGVVAHPIWVAFPAEAGDFTVDDVALAELGSPISDDVAALWQAEADRRGVDALVYRLLPVHPWQWEHKVQTVFADDLAAGRLIYVGEDPQGYRPQQSIRTWLPDGSSDRPYVKMSLSIYNMGFLRGLSPRYMRGNPEISAWLHRLVESDVEFGARGFRILREYATAGYTGDIYHRHGLRNDYTKMMAALWRENPQRHLEAGESLSTMAALLHVDAHGDSYQRRQLERSGLGAEQWLDAYFDAYVTPLLHLMVEHRCVGMPHGENIILRWKDGVPVGAYFKDIGEEILIAQPGVTLSPEAQRAVMDLPASELRMCFFTDMLDGFLRHHQARIADDGLLDPRAYWARLRNCVERYIDAHPAAREFDLLAPHFPHSCLNRLQLRNTTEMVDLTDPVGSLIYAGNLANPMV